MFIAICPHCGLYQTPKQTSFSNGKGYVRCMTCGNEYSYRALPLYVMLGASGTGKTTLALELQRVQNSFIVLDGDLLWRQEFMGQGNEEFFALWMNMALNISQCGKPVLLAMGGMPDDFMNNRNAKFFPSVHVLGLCADEEDLVSRLTSRPAWRASASDEFIESMRTYNRAVSGLAPSLNTTNNSIDDCVRYIKDFVLFS